MCARVTAPKICSCVRNDNARLKNGRVTTKSSTRTITNQCLPVTKTALSEKQADKSQGVHESQNMFLQVTNVAPHAVLTEPFQLPKHVISQLASRNASQQCMLHQTRGGIEKHRRNARHRDSPIEPVTVRNNRKALTLDVAGKQRTSSDDR